MLLLAVHATVFIAPGVNPTADECHISDATPIVPKQDTDGRLTLAAVRPATTPSGDDPVARRAAVAGQTVYVYTMDDATGAERTFWGALKALVNKLRWSS